MEHRFEPTLAELLSDPMVMIVMHRDGYDPDGVLQLFREVRHNMTLQQQKPEAEAIAA
ncbi:hypothetical protein M2352_004569 [Azospirillum fermentarium]|uniref:hypothetical protein n=1 Tax=Azospirillum fermentarium TaxID=1233114 RepID=UPI002225DE1F|nr:hypothetical protein [Azospirillum fermentarium]MCW2248909.1 hypothetical protein [Azospirillum fermentarium]